MLATVTCRENRARVPVEQLERYEGQWVAFAADGTRVVAGAPDLHQLVERLRQAGLDPSQVVFEHIEFDDLETFTGGAEAL